MRVENYDTEYRAMAVTGIRTDVDAADTIFSGKAGVLFQFTPTGNIYLSVRHHGDAAGLGQLRAERAAQQRQQPQRRPADLAQLRSSARSGICSGRRLSATVALFDTRNENVIYTIDATAVPPLFNQDDKQHVQGMTIGLVGQMTDHWSVMANFAYLDGKQDSQNVAINNMQLTLMPENLRQPVDHLQRPWLHHRRRASGSRTRPSSTPPTPSWCPAYHLSTGWRPTRSTRT